MTVRRFKSVPAVQKPPRESAIVVATTKLTTSVTKQVTIEVPSFQLRRRRQTTESNLIARLSSPSGSGHSSGYTQNIKFLAHGDHLHAIAGCNTIFRLMNKSEYQKFRAWADKFFGK